MELEGLKRALDYIDSCGLTVSEIVTDRHVQVKKYMNDKQADKYSLLSCLACSKRWGILFYYSRE